MRIVSKILILLMVFAAEQSNSQQLIVRVHPRRPGMIIVKRPHRPSARHVWVEDEWTPGGKTYIYRRGYWALPPHPQTNWIAGHWDHRGKGYFSVPGQWR